MQRCRTSCAGKKVPLTITPKHCCVMDTARHAAQCIRHALTQICTASGNLGKKYSENFESYCSSLKKDPFFSSQGSCCLDLWPSILLFSGCFPQAYRELLRAEIVYQPHKCQAEWKNYFPGRLLSIYSSIIFMA